MHNGKCLVCITVSGWFWFIIHLMHIHTTPYTVTRRSNYSRNEKKKNNFWIHAMDCIVHTLCFLDQQQFCLYIHLFSPKTLVTLVFRKFFVFFVFVVKSHIRLVCLSLSHSFSFCGEQHQVDVVQIQCEHLRRVMHVV